MGAIPYMAILAELTSDVVLDTAYDWLCRRRRAYPADADVWSFRQGWAREKDRLRAALAAGPYHFGLLTRVTLKDGQKIDLWAARDAGAGHMHDAYQADFFRSLGLVGLLDQQHRLNYAS